MAKIIDDVGIRIQVKAGLHVDDETLKVCLDLIGIYAREHEANAMLLKFDENFYQGYEMTVIKGNMQYCPLCYQDIKREGET